MNPPVLIFEAQVFLVATKQQHVLGFKLQAIRFRIEQSVNVNEAIFN